MYTAYSTRCNRPCLCHFLLLVLFLGHKKNCFRVVMRTQHKVSSPILVGLTHPLTGQILDYSYCPNIKWLETMGQWKGEHQLSSQHSSICLNHLHPVNRNRLLLTQRNYLKPLSYIHNSWYSGKFTKNILGKKLVLYIFRSKTSLVKVLSGCLLSSELASTGIHVANKSSLPKCHIDYVFKTQLLDSARWQILQVQYTV